MKKILIIEDEYYSWLRLKKLILDIVPTADIHGPLKTTHEVIEQLSLHNNYDLIFADIRLADGDVFDAFSQVETDSFVIFTTAYDEYALKAIKNNGLDYLMKPINASELADAIARWQKLISPPEPSNNEVNLTSHYRERFLVNKGDELKTLLVDDINYICVEENRAIAYTHDGTPHPLSQSMSEIEQELNPLKFFRLNRQYIASLNAFHKIGLHFGSRLAIKLKNCPDEQIVISKEKSRQLKEWLDH